MSLNSPFNEPPRRPDFDPYVRTGRSGRSFQYLHYLFVLAAVAIFLRLGWTYWHAWNPPAAQPPTATANALPTAPAVPNVPAAVVDGMLPPVPVDAQSDLVVHPSIDRRGQVDWAKSAQQRMKSESDKLRERCREWKAAVADWRKTVKPLLENDKGRIVAADPDTVRNFRAIYNDSLSEQSRCDEIEATLDSLTVNLAEVLNDTNSTYVPEEAAFTQIRDLNTEASNAVASHDTATKQIESLVLAAEKNFKPADKTLLAAIAEQEQADQMASIAEARERMDRARRQAAAQVSAAEEEAVKVAGETEAKRILAAVEAAKIEQQAAAERDKAAAEKQKKIAAMQRDMGDIKRYLAPFIAKGYAQPNGYHNTQMADEVPVSLSRLASSGALKSTREGMEQLMRYATVQNDRAHGGFPQYVGGDLAWAQTNKAFVKRAQELLNAHGEALVAEGILSE